MTIEINFECERCGARNEEDSLFTPGSEVEPIMERWGWAWFDGLLLCPECKPPEGAPDPSMLFSPPVFPF
jgi:hypothetical protein